MTRMMHALTRTRLTSVSPSRRRLRPTALLLSCLLAPALGQAQTTGPAEGTETEPEGVAIDALRCWRDLDRHALVVGEPFGMTVTCGAVETDLATTIPDESSLAPETIELAPFEVVDGERFADRYDPPFRFLQYRYRLRIIDEDALGADIELPALEIRYHIERTLAGAAAVAGRELTYVLPAETLRLLSLVPAETTDVQGVRVAPFGAADTREFRANLMLLGAGAAGLGAVGLLVTAGLRLRRRSTGEARREPAVSDQQIVGRAREELAAAIRTASSGGWQTREVERALAGLRLAGAAMVGHPVAQAPVTNGQPRDGQLHVRVGSWRPRAIALSSAVTAATLTDALEAGPPAVGAREDLEAVRDAVDLFTRTRFGANGAGGAQELTAALRRSLDAMERLRWPAHPLVRSAGDLRSAAGAWWTEVWSR